MSWNPDANDELTPRQRIERALRRRAEARPTSLVDMLDDHGIDTTPETVLEHIQHIRKSLSNDGEVQLLGAPPRCRECGFEKFDAIVNIPSSCPECRGEWIEEPRFTID